MRGEEQILLQSNSREFKEFKGGGGAGWGLNKRGGGGGGWKFNY